MGDPMEGFGLSWEQLVIAGAAFAVLIGVAIAAFRGAGSGRRKRHRAEIAGLGPHPEAWVPREPPRLAAATRAEPSLVRAEPEPPASQAIREPEPEPAEPPAPPPIARMIAEPEPEPERTGPPRPVPAPPPKPPRGVAMEDLRAEVEELREANTILKRRVEETERMLNDLQTEMQAKFASMERAAAHGQPPPPTPLRPPPPPRFVRPDAEADKEDNLERARRAIELLSSKDEDAS